MLSLAHSLALLLFAFSGDPRLTQAQQLVLNVTDTADQTRAGVWIKCKEGCTPKRSDANGTVALTLMSENLASGWVELQVIKRAPSDPDWVLLSPWDGKWPVSKRSLTLVVARKGDKQMLRDPKAVEAITARVLKHASTQLDRQISEEERRMVLKLQAEAVGLTPEEVDRAIREWGEKSKDPYQQGLAALYEKNYPKSSELLGQSYQMRAVNLEKAQADLFDVASFLGQSLYEQGRYREAGEKFHKASALRPEDDVTLSNLALSLAMAGIYAEAEPLFKRSLLIKEKTSGADYTEVATTLNNLAALYTDQGRYAEAEPLYKRSLLISEKALGTEHPDVANTLHNLALLYRAQGKYAEAEPLYKRSLLIKEKAFGAERPEVAITLANLAELYKAQGKYAEAEVLFKRSLPIIEKAFAEHPYVGSTLGNLAALYKAQGRYAEAEPLFKRSLLINEKVLGAEHPEVAITLENLAGLYFAQGKYGEAESLCRRSLQILEKMLGPEHPHVAVVLRNCAACLRKLNQEEEAKRLEERANSIKAKRDGQKQDE